MSYSVPPHAAKSHRGIIGLPASMLFSHEGKKVKTITGPVNRHDLARAIEGQL